MLTTLIQNTSTYNLNIWVDEQGIRNEKTLEISIPSYPDYALEYSNTHGTT